MSYKTKKSRIRGAKVWAEVAVLSLLLLIYIVRHLTGTGTDLQALAGCVCGAAFAIGLFMAGGIFTLSTSDEEADERKKKEEREASQRKAQKAVDSLRAAILQGANTEEELDKLGPLWSDDSSALTKLLEFRWRQIAQWGLKPSFDVQLSKEISRLVTISLKLVSTRLCCLFDQQVQLNERLNKQVKHGKDNSVVASLLDSFSREKGELEKDIVERKAAYENIVNAAKPFGIMVEDNLTDRIRYDRWRVVKVSYEPCFVLPE